MIVDPSEIWIEPAITARTNADQKEIWEITWTEAAIIAKTTATDDVMETAIVSLIISVESPSEVRNLQSAGIQGGRKSRR